jgi:hypothetical protein
MRTLVLGLLLLGCDGDIMNLSPDLTMMVVQPDLSYQSSCGFPGDQPLNATGIGKFCEEILDCKPAVMGDPNWKADLCSNFGDPTSHFCTFQCTPGNGDCGTGALCVCNNLGCGCAPATCAPPDAGTN